MGWGGGGRLRPPDVAIAVAAGIVQVVGTTIAARHQDPLRPLDALAYVLLAVGPLALVWRRRRPESVLVAAFAATLGYQLLGYPGGPVFVALAIAFLTAAVLRRRAFAYTVLAVGYVAFTWGVAAATGRGAAPLAALVGVGAWLLVLIAVAEGIRQRRAAVHEFRLRAAEAARSREQEQRRRASEERLDIARELHDVLAHSLSLINVQAGVALELVDRRPEQARQALAAIKAASRDAIVEVQAVLDSLRRKGESAPSAPAAGVGDLDGLVDRARRAGLDVRTVVEGRPTPLPPRVDLAAARVVQEALTNVARHSGAASAAVTVRYLPGEVQVQVDDDGRGPAGRSAGETGGETGGNGIPGMRERATALGGQLSAGKRPGGGFRVLARLPLPHPLASETSRGADGGRLGRGGEVSGR